MIRQVKGFVPHEIKHGGGKREPTLVCAHEISHSQRKRTSHHGNENHDHGSGKQNVKHLFVGFDRCIFMREILMMLDCMSFEKHVQTFGPVMEWKTMREVLDKIRVHNDERDHHQRPGIQIMNVIHGKNSDRQSKAYGEAVMKIAGIKLPSPHFLNLR